MENQRNPRLIHIRVHIPFCRSRCPYCNEKIQFADEATCRLYAQSLLREMEMAAPDFADAQVNSILFSGGCPTVLPRDAFLEVVQGLRKLYNVAQNGEISVETLPNGIDNAWMLTFQRSGVTRLSIGMVTGHAGDAKRIGIPASPGSMETTLILPQMYHLDSYEACLLYGLPGQTVQSFSIGLRFAVRYNTPEITLSRWQPTCGSWEPAADEASVCAMLSYADAHLKEKGYLQYRPGCWALPGHECTHRLGIEAGEELLSFGIGTQSLTEGIRYANTADLTTYLRYSDRPEKIYSVLPSNHL